MSRGLGRTQRAILAVLAGGKCGRVVDVAALVYSTMTPTRAQRESVRRAVVHLEAAGLVTTEITDELFSLRGQREWNRVVRGAPATTLRPDTTEQHLADAEVGATLSAPAPEQHLDDEPRAEGATLSVPRGTTWGQRVAAREAASLALRAYHEAGRHPLPEFTADCPLCEAEADHESRRHADLDQLPDGCSACDALADEWEAGRKAERKVELAAERKAEREAALVRAAWIEANPDAIAWRCTGCEAELTDADADQGQGPLYECSRCSTTFSRANSADGDGNRCPECNIFGTRIADMSCPECGEGELEPLDSDEQHLEADV